MFTLFTVLMRAAMNYIGINSGGHDRESVVVRHEAFRSVLDSLPDALVRFALEFEKSADILVNGSELVLSIECGELIAFQGRDENWIFI
jgi:hypothetical protein